MMDSTDMLAVRGLTKRYPAFVLEDVSFTLRPGRIMGLIGKNGAGKSTTLKAILRLVAPDAGEVRILGRDFRRGGDGLQAGNGNCAGRHRFLYV